MKGLVRIGLVIKQGESRYIESHHREVSPHIEQNLCTEDNIRAFDKLVFKRKIFFSSKDLPDVKSNCFLDIFADQGEVGDPYQKADVFYKALTELNEYSHYEVVASNHSED